MKLDKSKLYGEILYNGKPSQCIDYVDSENQVKISIQKECNFSSEQPDKLFLVTKFTTNLDIDSLFHKKHNLYINGAEKQGCEDGFIISYNPDVNEQRDHLIDYLDYVNQVALKINQAPIDLKTLQDITQELYLNSDNCENRFGTIKKLINSSSKKEDLEKEVFSSIDEITYLRNKSMENYRESVKKLDGSPTELSKDEKNIALIEKYEEEVKDFNEYKIDYALGQTCARNEEMELAIKFYQEIPRYSGYYCDAYYEMATIYSLTGDRESAIECILKSPTGNRIGFSLRDLDEHQQNFIDKNYHLLCGFPEFEAPYITNVQPGLSTLIAVAKQTKKIVEENQSLKGEKILLRRKTNLFVMR